jgi:hypothetical protein
MPFDAAMGFGSTEPAELGAVTLLTICVALDEVEVTAVVAVGDEGTFVATLDAASSFSGLSLVFSSVFPSDLVATTSFDEAV